MKTSMRSHHCGELSKDEEGKEVKLAGWVHHIRNLGGVIFITLRDRYGIIQLVIDQEKTKDLFTLAEQIRQEWVIQVEGIVQKRLEKMINPKMATGEIEIALTSCLILSRASPLPLQVADDAVTYSEELRLTYRYLDLRRNILTKNLSIRHKAMMATRNFLDKNFFVEVSTPILGKSTPEGARDYLVPSRIYPNHFYALPQSPQLFKQLLMIGGQDRYFQIAPCFRDEDLRSDRQPEFHQIDIEMSFAHEKDLHTLMEGLIAHIFLECLGVEIPLPFRRLSHSYCMETYGTDRPDLRFGMHLVNATKLAKESSFSLFHEKIEQGSIVKGFTVKGGDDLSRKVIEQYAEFVLPFGAKHLSFGKWQENQLKSSLTKYFSEDQQKELKKLFSLEEGDLFFLLADKPTVVNQSLDHLRRKIAKDRSLIAEDTYEFAWVVDFPLFAWDQEEQKMASEHHPFTLPHPEDLPLLDQDPLRARSSGYDLVLNGYEIGGGSQRIYDPVLQKKIFSLLQLSDQEIEDRFGFFISALDYGTPPHLGIAFGFDRIIMVLAKTENIRDVIAFPKTIKASDLMMEAPAEVRKSQWDDLHILPQKKDNKVKFDEKKANC